MYAASKTKYNFFYRKQYDVKCFYNKKDYEHSDY